MNTPINKSKNYFQVVLNNGKTHPQLFSDPQKAINVVGAKNIKMLREVYASQVDTRYVTDDGISIPDMNFNLRN